MRVLLIEPWYAGSHRAWADGYAASSAHDVRVISLPGRYWRWRLRGGAAALADLVRRDLAERGPVDLVLASSMVDLAQLLGLLRSDVGDLPVVAYLHESQLAYPHAAADDIDAAWRSWMGLAAADLVVLNSEHHRRELLAGISRLESTAPEPIVGVDIAARVAASPVIPVGVVAVADRSHETTSGPPIVLWPHRWDDDKRPDVFIRAVERLRSDGLEVRVVLAGEDGWADSRRRRAAAERLGDAVIACGPFDRAAYERWVGRSDIVVSVAEHEFFGVAVVEALSAGAVPVLPRAHSYPELILAPYHDAALYPEGGFRRALARVVADLDTARNDMTGLAASMERFSWAMVAPRLDRALAEVAGH